MIKTSVTWLNSDTRRTSRLLEGGGAGPNRRADLWSEVTRDEYHRVRLRMMDAMIAQVEAELRASRSLLLKLQTEKQRYLALAHSAVLPERPTLRLLTSPAEIRKTHAAHPAQDQDQKME